MYTLHIANKNYSSWSLRPWALMRELRIPFTESLIPFHQAAVGRLPAHCAERQGAVSGRWRYHGVGVAGDRGVPGGAPCRAFGLKATDARAWSRSACRGNARRLQRTAQLLFDELRGTRAVCIPCTAASTADLERISALWNDGLDHFGGPFLAGAAFSAVDAFFAPVVFRIQTYGLELDPAARATSPGCWSATACAAWYAGALREPWRDAPHDAEIAQFGAVLQDFRAPGESWRPIRYTCALVALRHGLFVGEDFRCEHCAWPRWPCWPW